MGWFFLVVGQLRVSRKVFINSAFRQNQDLGFLFRGDQSLVIFLLGDRVGYGVCFSTVLRNEILVLRVVCFCFCVCFCMCIWRNLNFLNILRMCVVLVLVLKGRLVCSLLGFRVLRSIWYRVGYQIYLICQQFFLQFVYLLGFFFSRQKMTSIQFFLISFFLIVEFF